MISGTQKSIIFGSIFHGFFEVSPETLSEIIFGAKIPNLASKMRFWSDLGFSRGPKIDPWRIIFRQLAPKMLQKLSRVET